MKRIYHYAVLALTLGLGACTQDDAPDLQEQEIRIATRSTSDENATETFTDDFTLELWSTTDNAKYETHEVTHNGTEWNTVKSSILPAHAFAYKGSSVTDIFYTDKWNYTVNLQLDQSDVTKLANADMMIATGDAVADSPLDLNFEHVFAKVTFNVTYKDFTNNPALTEIKSGNISCFLNEGKIEMIMNPGTFAAEAEILSLKVSGVSQTVKLKDESIFKKGAHYTYNLTIGTKEATLTATNVGYPGGWSDSETELN